MSPNLALKNAVVDAFRREPHYLIAHVNVDADSRIITLSGTVAHAAERRAAERVARHVAGVLAINNHLSVRASQLPPPSTPVTVSIRDAFARDPSLDASGVHVTAVAGAVVLTGTIRTWDDKAKAGYAALHAPGVSSLDNQIAVRV